ncbi:mannosyl-3-phosphoglycerate phosphatase [Escherichia coli]|uniref:Mannosyl-3-phosphoglycerate phosphatase n=1 Tax=Escherichia coli TaxID=562 RepID=A0A377B962_ECOLX|nr:mannosyl-3-phosphoglycerate phosphatase [Escherichia coli]
MFSIQQPLLVFSDLDGTLLDSHSYDWQPAAPWLSRLREANVPSFSVAVKLQRKCCTCKKRWGYKGYR